MAELPSVFKASDHDKMSGFEPLPAGWYLVEIVKSELRDTNAGDGKYLKLEMKVLDNEDYPNRRVWNNLNLINKSKQAVEIAQKELATICECCGLDMIEDSNELHNIPFAIKLSIKPATATWPAGNNVKGYKSEEDFNNEPESSENPFG